MEITEVQSASEISPWKLLWIWTAIGVQSFGGGSATLFLIRKAAVEQHRWLTDDDLSRYWGICQIAPGINILGLVILIGFRVSGVVGAAISLAGLLLPSAAITAGLTAIYAGVRQIPLVRAAIAGIVPATVGLGMLLAYNMLRPLLHSAWREGRDATVVAVGLVLASALAAALTQTPVPLILWCAGGISGVAHWQRSSRRGGP